VAPGAVECFVRSGPALADGPLDTRWDHHWRAPDGVVVLSCARDGDSYRVGMPGLATFLIENDGRAITCRSERAVPPGTLEHLLIDQVLPRVLAHRGRLVLHAGAVATDRGAIGFLGDSGAGKSTLCAAFTRARHPLLGDDGIVVGPAAAGGFEALGTYAGLRLFPDPLGALFDERAGASPVAYYTAKRRLDRQAADIVLANGPQPLRALYVLGSAEAIHIDELPVSEAFMSIVKASFLLHLDDAVRSGELFSRVGALQGAVPVRRLSYPRELSRLAEVREAVLADLEALPTLASSAGCACS
jgi:hypothetical protein